MSLYGLQPVQNVFLRTWLGRDSSCSVSCSTVSEKMTSWSWRNKHKAAVDGFASKFCSPMCPCGKYANQVCAHNSNGLNKPSWDTSESCQRETAQRPFENSSMIYFTNIKQLYDTPTTQRNSWILVAFMDFAHIVFFFLANKYCNDLVTVLKFNSAWDDNATWKITAWRLCLHRPHRADRESRAMGQEDWLVSGCFLRPCDGYKSYIFQRFKCTFCTEEVKCTGSNGCEL